MSKKWILYIPLILVIVGAILGIKNEPEKDWAYYLGSGLGLFIIAAIPGAIFGTIHFFVSKKKQVEVELDDQLLDTNRTGLAKTTWYRLFCAYTGGMGVFFAFIVLLGEN